LIVLSTNRLASLQPAAARIVDAVNTIKQGGYIALWFDRPARNRRLSPHRVDSP
jgi:hypothetical protein